MIHDTNIVPLIWYWSNCPKRFFIQWNLIHFKQRYCRNRNLALLWPKHGNKLFKMIEHYYGLIFCIYMVFLGTFEPSKTNRSNDTVIIATKGYCMAKTWASPGPSHWFFLKLIECIQGCFVSILRVVASMLTDISNLVTSLVTQQLSHSVIE